MTTTTAHRPRDAAYHTCEVRGCTRPATRTVTVGDREPEDDMRVWVCADHVERVL